MPYAKSHVIAVVRRCCLQDVAPAVVVAPVYPLRGGPQNRAVASVHVLMARSSDLQRPRTRGEETSALSRGRRSSSRSFWRSLSCVFRVALFAANECVIAPRGARCPRERVVGRSNRGWRKEKRHDRGQRACFSPGHR